jgi:hypothetical protein
MAEDPVSSEPFFSKFPVTAKNTGKLKRFPPEQLPLNSPKMPFQSYLSDPPPLFDGKIEQGILIGITGIQSGRSRTPRWTNPRRSTQRIRPGFNLQNFRRFRRNNYFLPERFS